MDLFLEIRGYVVWRLGGGFQKHGGKAEKN